jgi:hypothetical protein
LPQLVVHGLYPRPFGANIESGSPKLGDGAMDSVQLAAQNQYIVQGNASLEPRDLDLGCAYLASQPP